MSKSRSFLEYQKTVPKVDSRDLSKIIDDNMAGLSIKFARMYQGNARTFVNCFIKFASMKTACAFVVQSYKHTGAFKDCLETGKDFTEYADRQPIEEKWKRVLAEVLLIIYSIINN